MSLGSPSRLRQRKWNGLPAYNQKLMTVRPLDFPVSLLSAKPVHAGRQGCQQDRGITHGFAWQQRRSVLLSSPQTPKLELHVEKCSVRPATFLHLFTRRALKTYLRLKNALSSRSGSLYLAAGTECRGRTSRGHPGTVLNVHSWTSLMMYCFGRRKLKNQNGISHDAKPRF